MTETRHTETWLLPRYSARDSWMRSVWSIQLYSSCRASESLISNQGAFEPTKMWPSGTAPGSSSSDPAGMFQTPTADSRGTKLPQSPQKLAPKRSVPGRSNPRTRSSPWSHSNTSGATNRLVAWAAARLRRHREQWQLRMAPGRPLNRKLMAPHRQLPRQESADGFAGRTGRSILRAS